MRIIWDEQNKRFVAEFAAGEQWRYDQESAKDSGFRTTGAPDWIWWTDKATTLNKLKKIGRPISITEVALEHYKKLNQKIEEKENLRKQFKQALKEAAKQNLVEAETYVDEETGIICLKPTLLPPEIRAILDAPVKKIIRDEPKSLCLLCDSPLYEPFDGKTFCLYCEKESA